MTASLTTNLALPGYDKNNIFALPQGMSKMDAYKIHHGQSLIAADDIRDAEIRARYHEYMIYLHGLWKTIINPTTGLPVYDSWTDWVIEEGTWAKSTTVKYVGQMRMLAAAGMVLEDLDRLDVGVVEYLWSKADISRQTGQVIGFIGQPKEDWGIPEKANAIIHRAINEVGFTLDGQNVPKESRKDALHQVVNPLQPKYWVERDGDSMTFRWNKMTYPDGGDSPGEKLTGKFAISSPEMPGDVVAFILKMLHVFD